MNILYIVQQSIYNNENKWLSADSNIQMTMGIVNELILKTDWNVDIMLAPLDQFEDLKDYQNLCLNESPRIRFISRPGPVSAFTNRYHFDAEDFEFILTHGKYDVIINNIIELTRNIKTVLYDNKLKAKLIVGNYWIDCPEVGEGKVPQNISYDWRQIDGAECADLITFTCYSTKKIFFQNLEHKFSSKSLSIVLQLKSVIWDFGFSAEELDRYKTNEKFDTPTIVFPNRLSGINYTHHKEFIQVVNELYDEGLNFQVVFTNPSGKVSWDFLKREVKPLKIISENPLSRKEYVELLWKSNIVASLYTIERYGGCANVEAIYCGNYPVMTNFGEYTRRVQKDFNNFVETDLSNLKEVLKNALTKKPHEKFYSENKNLVKQNSSYEVVSKYVISDIERITE